MWDAFVSCTCSLFMYMDFVSNPSSGCAPATRRGLPRPSVPTLPSNLQTYATVGYSMMTVDTVSDVNGLLLCKAHLVIVYRSQEATMTTRSSAIAGRPCDAKAFQGLLKWTWK